MNNTRGWEGYKLKVIELGEFKVKNNCILFGRFDGVHKGHRSAIDLLINEELKGLNSVMFYLGAENLIDNDAKRLYTEEEKRMILDKNGPMYYVDGSKEMDLKNMGAEQFIEEILVNRLDVKTVIIGEGYRFGKSGEGSIDTLKRLSHRLGFEIVEVKIKTYENKPITSNRIIDEIMEGNIICANEMLGEPYFIVGEVIHGRALGRTVGMPTANLSVPEEKINPKHGVYATLSKIDNEIYKGLTNIGRRPSVDDYNYTTIETFLMDFSQDIYGKRIKVEIHNYIRGVVKFNNLKEVKEQVEKDIEKIKDCFKGDLFRNKLKAVYYINQFYAGIGGEGKADVGLMTFDEKKGPAIGIEDLWQGEMEIVKVISCGDNFINNEEKFKSVLPEINNILKEANPDVFIAGPAFNAGRYGVACGKLCDYVKNELKIPSVTSMYYENPAVNMYVKNNYIVESTETSAGMRKVLPTLANLSLKLAKRENIGPARLEGYLPTGHRYNEYHDKTGAERTVEILLRKLNNENYTTEVPLRDLDKVSPAAPFKDIENAKIALITTGGLVPKGNPDKLKQAFSVTYGKYNIDGLDSIQADEYESIHGGYDTTIVNQDPNRLVPLDELRNLEREGKVGEIYEKFFTTCGIGTNVENSKDIGRKMVEDLKRENVDIVILTST